MTFMKQNKFNYIFSCKYKSSKPSIVEYVYKVKNNFKTDKNKQTNKFQFLKEKRKFLNKSGKNYSEKEFI